MVRFPSVELVGSQNLLSALFDNSKVGLAVFDEHCRYCLVNRYLAASNCTSIEDHLGKPVREILGRVGLQVEQAIKQVFTTAEPLLNCEFEGSLPRKSHGHWIDNFFPIMDVNGKVVQVAAMVVELGTAELNEKLTPYALTSRVLRSWKDIASYVGACVKTVQRWEHSYNFPVRRVSPNKGSVVFALQAEIDEWLRSRGVHRSRTL